MRYTFITLFALGCVSEPEFICTSVGTADCPMSLCCSEDSHDVGDCYIETDTREYRCPGDGDATCEQGVCRALRECYDDATLTYVGC